MTGTATTMGAYIRGLDAFPATVRASIEDGLPGLFVEGSGNPTEMRERVRCAIKMSGFAMPERGRIRIIMEPSLVLNSVPSTLDLAVAVAILAASGQIAPEYCEKRLFFGTLDLASQVSARRGVYCASKLAAEAGHLLVTHVGAERLLAGCDYCDIRTLKEFQGAPVMRAKPFAAADDSDVWAKDLFSRGEVIAAAGKLGAAIVGEGINSLTFSRHVRALMPAMDEAEWDCVNSVYSVIGEPEPMGRPVCKIKRGESLPDIIGGGLPVLPGEVTLASGGVLMVGDIAMMPSTTVSALKRVAEDGRVRIVRVNGSYEFPADCVFIADANGAIPEDMSEKVSRAYRSKAMSRAREIADIVIESNDGVYTYDQARGMVETAWGILRERPRPSKAVDRIAQAVVALDGNEVPGPQHYLEAQSLSLDSVF